MILRSARRPAPAPPAPEIVNAYWDRDSLFVVERRGSAVSTRRERARHCCFLRRSEVDAGLERELRASRHVAGMREEGAHLRVSWRERWACLQASRTDGFFAARGVTVLEADVDPVRRWITDERVQVARPRRCYLDIEADSRERDRERARMLAWSVAVDGGEVVASAVLAEESDAAERVLVEALWRALDAYDQVCAWAGDFFDFPHLFGRTKRRRVPVETRRWLWLDQLKVFQKMNISASESGDEKQSLKLGSVARKLVGEDKLEGDGSMSWELWLADSERLRRYCANDARLLALIEGATGYVELLLSLCQCSFTFPDTGGIRPTRQVEGFLLRLGAERDHRFPTFHYAEESGEEEQFKGAYVMDPTRTGIVRDVHVCDFARLYPNVMRTFNLSPETVRGRLVAGDNTGVISLLTEQEAADRSVFLGISREQILKEDRELAASLHSRVPEGCCLVPLTNVIVANEPRGILPIALDELLALRKKWDDVKAALPPGSPEWKDADRRSTAYKNSINAFYGVTGSRFSRFYVLDVAESTAQGGVWLIQETIAAARERGLEIFYCDTDSGFEGSGATDEEFLAFVRWCNAELYPRLVRERGATRNHIELAYEKKFRRLVLVAKKRYAGRYAHFKGKAARDDAKFEVKGLEYKRGDAVRLARELQMRAIEMLLREECEDPAAYERLVEAFKERVLKDKLSLEDVFLSKRLTKPLGEYARKRKQDGEWARQSVHVEVARVLKERGERVEKGAKIDFVMVEGPAGEPAAIPAADYAGECDRYHLWEQLVYPPTLRVLEAAFSSGRWERWERLTRPVARNGQVRFDFMLAT